MSSEVMGTQTREMLAIWLRQLRFSTMAREVLSAKDGDLPKYARVILNNINDATTKAKVRAGFAKLGLI